MNRFQRRRAEKNSVAFKRMLEDYETKGFFIWTTKEGIKIPIQDITNKHLVSILKLLRRTTFIGALIRAKTTIIEKEVKKRGIFLAEKV